MDEKIINKACIKLLEKTLDPEMIGKHADRIVEVVIDILKIDL